MIAKLAIVEEEADESLYWMDLLVEAHLVNPAKLAPLMSEANEILAMVVASIRALRFKQRKEDEAKRTRSSNDT